MTCDVEKITALHDGELSREEAVTAHQHLDACADCRQELESLKAADQGFRTAFVAAVPTGFAARTARQIVQPAPKKATWQQAVWGTLALVALTTGAAVIDLQRDISYQVNAYNSFRDAAGWQVAHSWGRVVIPEWVLSVWPWLGLLIGVVACRGWQLFRRGPQTLSSVLRQVGAAWVAGLVVIIIPLLSEATLPYNNVDMLAVVARAAIFWTGFALVACMLLLLRVADRGLPLVVLVFSACLVAGLATERFGVQTFGVDLVPLSHVSARPFTGGRLNDQSGVALRQAVSSPVVAPWVRDHLETLAAQLSPQELVTEVLTLGLLIGFLGGSLVSLLTVPHRVSAALAVIAVSAAVAYGLHAQELVQRLQIFTPPPIASLPDYPDAPRTVVLLTHDVAPVPYPMPGELHNAGGGPDIAAARATLEWNESAALWDWMAYARQLPGPSYVPSLLLREVTGDPVDFGPRETTPLAMADIAAPPVEPRYQPLLDELRHSGDVVRKMDMPRLRPQPASLTGRVVINGKPAADAGVRLFYYADSTADPKLARNTLLGAADWELNREVMQARLAAWQCAGHYPKTFNATRTDRNGGFSFSHLSTGWYLLGVLVDGNVHAHGAMPDVIKLDGMHDLGTVSLEVTP